MPRDTSWPSDFRKLWTLAFAMIALAGASLTTPAQAQSTETQVTGLPEVIDADILKFNEQRVILWGVDAPERPQTCYLNGALWGCYDVAKRKLELLAGRGDVTCVYKGEPDPFGRRYGVCTSGGEDLNAEMVKSGVALAFEEQSDDYLVEMVDAISEGVGLWQTGVIFEEPWIFRQRETRGGYR